MTIQECIDFIENTNGKIFAIKFIKRTTNELREMVCRTGVTKHLKGIGKTYDPATHKLITVYDMKSAGYRSISIEGITQIKVKGEWEDVTHA